MATATPELDASKPAQVPVKAGDLFRRMTNTPPKKESKADEKKPEEKAAEKSDDKAKPAAKVEEKAPAKKIAPKKSAPAPAQTIDTDALSKGIVDGLTKASKVAEKPEPKITDGLTDKQKKKVAVLQNMEKDGGKGYVDAYVGAIKKLDTYKAEWESKNRGKAFNIDDEEHDDFVKANDVMPWDEDEFTEARINMAADERVKKTVAEHTKPLEDKIKANESERERTERAAKEVPLVIEHQAATARVLFDKLGEDFKAILKPNGDIDKAAVTEAIAQNPIYKKVFPIAMEVEQFAGELMQIARGHKPFALTLPKNATDEQRQEVNVHRRIVAFVDEQEHRISHLPDEQRINSDGKDFATADEWNSLSPEQRKNRWRLSEKDLSALYAFDGAIRAKKIIAEEEEMAQEVGKKRGYIKPEDGKAAGEKKNDAKVEADKKPADKGEKEEEVKAPAGVAAPRMARSDRGAVQPQSTLLSRHTGGR